MSRRINPTASSPEAVKLAEAAREYHWSIVTHEDDRIAGSWTPHYQEAKKMFLKAVKIAYPHMDAKRIYLVWVDNNESIQYCVDYIARNGYPF